MEKLKERKVYEHVRRAHAVEDPEGNWVEFLENTA